MFIKTIENASPKLTFIKSSSVGVFPCGRRRSQELVEVSSSSTYRFPFDPEAKLNTELNSRKLSSSNGFSQNFIKSFDAVEKEFILSLAGYLFTIRLDSAHDSVDSFVNAILSALGTTASDTSKIYANILIEKTPLLSSGEEVLYATWVLRNQSDTAEADIYLDKLKDSGNPTSREDYYFSGLSFSTSEISAGVDQKAISLEIFHKYNAGDPWTITNRSQLPKISHGGSDDSVQVEVLEAGVVAASTIYKGPQAQPVAVVRVEEDGGTWKLVIS